MAVIKIKILGSTFAFDGDAWALDYGMDPADTDAIRDDIKQSVKDGLAAHYGDTLGVLIKEP